jgi:hypothetical protein
VLSGATAAPQLGQLKEVILDPAGFSISNLANIQSAGRQFVIRACVKINSHFGASAGRADARRRDAGDVVHRRGAATQQMPARRRAPKDGKLSDIQFPMMVSNIFLIPESFPQNVKLFLRKPLARLLLFATAMPAQQFRYILVAIMRCAV